MSMGAEARLQAMETEIARLHGCVGVLSESLHITLVALEAVMEPGRADAFMHTALVDGLRPRVENDYAGQERAAALEMLAWIAAMGGGRPGRDP